MLDCGLRIADVGLRISDDKRIPTPAPPLQGEGKREGMGLSGLLNENLFGFLISDC